MSDAIPNSKFDLGQIQRIVRRNLKLIESSFPDYYNTASVTCDQLLVADNLAYGLMTRVNVLALAEYCSQVGPAAENAMVIVKDVKEFELRFASRIATADGLLDQLEILLTEEEMTLLKKNVINRQLKVFLKEHSLQLQALLFELQFPYGKCTCGKPKMKPFHSKCSACYGAETRKVQIPSVVPASFSKKQDLVVVPPSAPGMTSLEAAFVMAEAEEKARSEKRKKGKKGKGFGEEEPEFTGNKARSGRRGRGHEDSW